MEWLKLINLRESKNLSRKDLAQALNVSIETIGKWEDGTRNPTIPGLVAIAQFFHVSADYLIGIEEKEIIITEDEYKSLEQAKNALEAIEKRKSKLQTEK